jgi:serine/threonine-protein kinase
VFADQLGRERLLREFRALRDLDEPHVVRVRDLELTDDDGALILDYVAGPSLATRLSNGPRLSTSEAISIALDVAAALGAAHAAGIVHRDVTPGNVLLDPGDGARLTDFGIALGGAGTTGEPALTATGELVGTLRYLAPEQLRGAPATPASDVHALAAVTYEMLADRHAYEAASPVALAEAQARGVEPIPSGATRPRCRGPSGALAGPGGSTGRCGRVRGRDPRSACHRPNRARRDRGADRGSHLVDARSATRAVVPVPLPRPDARPGR